MDLILVIAAPQPYIASDEWLSSLGGVWLTFLEPTAIGNQVERRARVAIRAIRAHIRVVPLCLPAQTPRFAKERKAVYHTRGRHLPRGQTTYAPW